MKLFKGKEVYAFYVYVVAIIVLFGMLLVSLVFLQEDGCVCDNKSFTISGVVVSTSYIGDCIRIDFDDGRCLFLHGSPDAQYDGWEMIHLLYVGGNYSFSYHHACVMSDGNTPTWFEGNVIDEIRVIN